MKEKQDGKGKKLWIVLPVLGMIAGLILLLYPKAMDMYSSYLNSKAISTMTSSYDRYEGNAQEISRQLECAEEYNECLADGTECGVGYEDQLTFDGNGVMGYIEIPCIDVKMLIYHGTSDETLAAGAGHLEGTSLPVGGSSTHSVITAHSGMKNMSAFDNLRLMKEGDLFYVTVLGRKSTYVVESIETVLPEETDSLQIVQGEDRITLVTCTPYGINDHRLLVHGIRTEDNTDEESTAETEVSVQDGNGILLSDIRTLPLMIAAAIVIAAAAVLVIRKRRKGKNDSENNTGIGPSGVHHRRTDNSENKRKE